MYITNFPSTLQILQSILQKVQSRLYRSYQGSFIQEWFWIWWCVVRALLTSEAGGYFGDNASATHKAVTVADGLTRQAKFRS